MFHELYKNTTGIRVYRDNVLTAKPKTFGVWPFAESLGLHFCKEKKTHPGTRPFLILPPLLLNFLAHFPPCSFCSATTEPPTEPTIHQVSSCWSVPPCPGTSAPNAHKRVCHTSLAAHPVRPAVYLLGTRPLAPGHLVHPPRQQSGTGSPFRAGHPSQLCGPPHTWHAVPVQGVLTVLHGLRLALTMSSSHPFPSVSSASKGEV